MKFGLCGYFVKVSYTLDDCVLFPGIFRVVRSLRLFLNRSGLPSLNTGDTTPLGWNITRIPLVAKFHNAWHFAKCVSRRFVILKWFLARTFMRMPIWIDRDKLWDAPLKTLVYKFNFLFVPRNSIGEFSSNFYAEFRYVYRIFLSGRASKIQ